MTQREIHLKTGSIDKLAEAHHAHGVEVLFVYYNDAAHVDISTSPPLSSAKDEINPPPARQVVDARPTPACSYL
jgi:hypothetical protein